VSPTAQFWLMTIVLALGTWLMRALPIMLHGHVAHPPWLERLLKHVPVAALTALVVPGARLGCWRLWWPWWSLCARRTSSRLWSLGWSPCGSHSGLSGLCDTRHIANGASFAFLETTV